MCKVIGRPEVNQAIMEGREGLKPPYDGIAELWRKPNRPASKSLVAGYGTEEGAKAREA